MREISYNKKGTFSFSRLNVYLNKLPYGTYSATLILTNECHFFMAITRKVRSNKMIAMSLRTFIIKVLVFIFIKPPLYKD